MSARLRTEEWGRETCDNLHIQLWLKKKKASGKEKKKIRTPIVGGAQSAHWAYWLKRHECWSEAVPFKEERGEHTPTITLPSSDSFERSQPEPELYF